MKSLLAVLLFTTLSFGMNAVNDDIRKVENLVATHRTSIGRLRPAATASAENLVSGGTYYLCCGDNAFISEAYGRAGGSLGVKVYLGETLTSKDVIWVSYDSATYRSVASAIDHMRVPDGAVVVWFGPRPPGVVPKNWIDSFTPWSETPELTLMGNMLSLWSLTGELAAATAREGKTMAFWQSLEDGNESGRNQLYENLLFHDGGLRMSREIASGWVAARYLDYVSKMVVKIADEETSKIVAVGQMMAKRATPRTHAILGVDSHSVRFPAARENPYFRFFDMTGTTPLASVLHSNDFFVALGYLKIDEETMAAVEKTPGASAAWFAAIRPDDHKATFVREHWKAGDAAVSVPGYDIPILPPSGIAQLFIYDLLLDAAAGSRGPTE